MTMNAIANSRAAGADIYNLQADTQRFLINHPTIHKVAMLVNQLVRAFMASAMMGALGMTPMSAVAVGLGTAVFYWLTVEGNCRNFQFAIPGFVGAVAAQISAPGAVAALVNGAAYHSLQAFAATLTGAWPFCLYFVGVTYMVHRDVERIHGR